MQVGRAPGGLSLPQPLLSARPALGSDQVAQGFAQLGLKKLHGQRSHRHSFPLHCPGGGRFLPMSSPNYLVSSCQGNTGPHKSYLSPAFPPEAGHKMLIHKNLLISLMFRRGLVPAVNYPLPPRLSSKTVTGDQSRHKLDSMYFKIQ